ncbi:MAG: hypothetical protein GF353_01350 [Candidatus Lokiarchaeota archaeon]|nr:hypothetical protein [Candidatus Lokiarchaeota archaeon]
MRSWWLNNFLPQRHRGHGEQKITVLSVSLWLDKINIESFKRRGNAG